MVVITLFCYNKGYVIQKTCHSDQNPPKTKIGFFGGTPCTDPN